MLLPSPFSTSVTKIPSSSQFLCFPAMPPQESTGPEASDPAGQATASAPPAATPAPEGDIPAHMQPLRIQLGVH